MLTTARTPSHLRIATMGMAALLTACGNAPTTPTPPPTPVNLVVSSLVPTAGSVAGGTTVTISGAGFGPGIAVDFDGTAATAVTVVNDTTVTAVAPARAAGSVVVTVRRETSSASLPSAFTFVDPTTGPNIPPRLEGLGVEPPQSRQPASLASTRDRIRLVAQVSDDETPVDALLFEWTAEPAIGMFEGSGRDVIWVAPDHTDSATPVTLRVVVTERFVTLEGDTAIAGEHRVDASAMLTVHDSVREIGDAAIDFLTRFSDSSLGPDDVLHNFSQTCDRGRGYGEEYSDVVANRASRLILSHTFGPPAVSFAFGRAQACANKEGTPGDACTEVVVHWVDQERPTPGDPQGGAPVDVRGTSYLSAVYEAPAWKLCHSRWTAFETATGRVRRLDFGRTPSVVSPRSAP